MKQIEFCLGKVYKRYPGRYYSEGPSYRFKEPYYLTLNDNDDSQSFFIWLRDNFPNEFIKHDYHKFFKGKDVLVIRMSSSLDDEEFFILDGTIGKAFINDELETLYKKYLKIKEALI